MRRVVITGMGLVTPLGVGVQTNWDRLIKSQSGIRTIQGFDVSDLPCRIAGQVPRGDGSDSTLNLDLFIPPKEQKKMDDFIMFAIAAAEEAIKDSGWKPSNDEEFERTGVSVGSGIGGLPGIYETSLVLAEKGPRRVSPFFIPSCLINLASGHISINHGYKGPNHAVVTACSTGAHSIGDAARMIALDDADVMVAGGAEGACSRLGIAGFAAARALSTGYNDTPAEVTLSLDDFGAGYSTLILLSQLAIAEVKIEQALIATLPDAKSQSIVRFIVEVAHRCGAIVVAEGTETLAQEQELRALGVDVGQGYLYSAALPADEFRRFAAS